MADKKEAAARPAPTGTGVAPQNRTDQQEAEKPANIDQASAEDIEASGAILEPQTVDGIDPNHPAVDANPRERTTAVQNQIDFNDPTKGDADAVREGLEKSGK